MFTQNNDVTSGRVLAKGASLGKCLAHTLKSQNRQFFERMKDTGPRMAAAKREGLQLQETWRASYTWQRSRKGTEF